MPQLAPIILSVPDLRDRQPTDNSNQDWYCTPRDYTMSIRDNGGVPLILPFATPCIEQYLQFADGIMLTGNNFFTPHDEAKNIIAKRSFENILISQILETQIPLLCIAESSQLLGDITQGYRQDDKPIELMQHSNSRPKTTMDGEHEINVTTGSLIYKICNSKSIKARAFCRQKITKLKPSLSATAFTSDGAVACIENPTKNFCIGIQWHAELLSTEYDQKIINAFVQAAIHYRQQKQNQTEETNRQLQSCL